MPTNDLEKNSVGLGGGVTVRGNMSIPVGNYWALQFVTSGSLVSIDVVSTTLSAGNFTNKVFPEGFVLKTPFRSAVPSTGTEVIAYESVSDPILKADPVAVDYIRRVEAYDGQALEPAVRAAMHDFIVGLKQDGLLAQIGTGCLLAGPRTIAGAVQPLVSGAATPVLSGGGTPSYNRTTGLQLDQTITVDVISLNYPLNSYSQSVWASTLPATAGETLLLTDDYFSYIVADSSNIAVVNRDVIGQTVTKAAGFIGTSRNSSTGYDYNKDSTAGFATRASTASVTHNYLYVGPTQISSNPARFKWFHEGRNLNLTALYNRLNTYFNTITNLSL